MPQQRRARGDDLALLGRARFREERYAAVELPRLSATHRALVDASLLPVAEKLIRDSAWWDLVDDLSGELLQALYDCILPSIGAGPLSGEFFIHKGIGWALRERAYDAPEEVQAFCREYASQLAPLSVREALRVLQERSKTDGQEQRPPPQG